VLKVTFRLPSRVAFYLQASIIVALLASSSAPTPLYAVYQREWGFSPITTTVVFGVYAVAVLIALLTVGSLSDHIGRRPVLIAALILQALVMVVFAVASGVDELLIARIAQGLATGAALGAVGAGLLDIDRAKGTLANSIAPMTGTATGALGSALLAQYLPAPTRLVYLVLLAIFAIQAAGVLLARETAAPRPGAWASLRPEIGVPPRVRMPLLLAAPAVIAAWSLAGFYGSLGPTLVRYVSGSSSFLLGGLSLTVIAGAACLVVVLRNRSPRTVVLVGTAALILGVGLVMLAVELTNPVLFFVASAIAGIGFGGSFQGAIRTVVPLAETHQRAGVLSTLFVVSYLAMGLPAVAAGVLVVHGGGVLSTARMYGVAVIALALVALAGQVRRPRPIETTRIAAEPAERTERVELVNAMR
jgi:predicted MFS family arabinose efflux permease